MKNKFQQGFTLIEIAVSMGIFAILVGFITLNLNTAQRQVSVASTVETLLSDLGQQQIKAMVGDTEGRSESDTYGIYFDTDNYTLFHGTYTVGEPTNFSINLPPAHQFDPSSRSEIIFEKGSGEIYQFSNESNQIIIQDTASGETKTITINKYGVITAID